MKKEKLVVKSGKSIWIISYYRIIYLLADGRYTSIFTTTKKVFLCKNLGEFEKSLPSPPFVRTHYSYLVNINNIIELKDGCATMTNGDIVLVSKRKLLKLKGMINNLS